MQLHQNKLTYHTKILDDKHHHGDPQRCSLLHSYSHCYPEEERRKQYHIKQWSPNWLTTLPQEQRIESVDANNGIPCKPVQK